MSTDADDAPDVPIVCSECGTNTRVPLSEVRETIEAHNERLHDGEEVAEVAPDLADHLADLIAADILEG